MKFVFSVIVVLFPTLVLANTKNCDDLALQQARLATLGSNLENAETTRTTEGGAYRPLRVGTCAGGICEVMRDDRGPLLKYRPDHPDANEDGYVAYPNINRAKAFAEFNAAAIKLRLLSSQNHCAASVTDQNNSILIRYSKDSKVISEDLLVFGSASRVELWERTSRTGVASTVSFERDGHVIQE